MPQYIVRLEVVDGPLTGQTVVVRDHGTLVVGRLPECGIAVPQDVTVSRRHFQIDYKFPTCQLSNLSQTGETLVNGRPASIVELSEDDEIVFGQGNKVRVHFEDAFDGAGCPTTSKIEYETQKSKLLNGFTTSDARCGWHLYETMQEQLGYDAMFEILSSGQQISAVIDFRRIGLPAPSDLVEPHFLFSWIPSPSREQFSPMLISISDNPAVEELIHSGWGKDGIVCFGSKLKGAELAAYWRKAIGVSEDKPAASMIAYFWPSILQKILASQPAEQLDFLLGELSLLFMENPASKGNWSLFTKEDFAADLKIVGLVDYSLPLQTK